MKTNSDRDIMLNNIILEFDCNKINLLFVSSFVTIMNIFFIVKHKPKELECLSMPFSFQPFSPNKYWLWLHPCEFSPPWVKFYLHFEAKTV